MSGEQGFHSFTFHPDFASTGAADFGKFNAIHSTSTKVDPSEIDFVSNTPPGNPTPTLPHHTVLMEWSTTNPLATSSSPGGSGPREALRLEQPCGNHNAGLIAFNTSDSAGSDRNHLYIAIGDGGSGNDPPNNSQDP